MRTWKSDLAAFLAGWVCVLTLWNASERDWPWMWADLLLLVFYLCAWVKESGGAQGKLLWGAKDGGPESKVWMWGVESKRFGSLLLLRFAPGSREAFHTHAFNAWSWVLRGTLVEQTLPERGPGWAERLHGDGTTWAGFGPSWRVIYTDHSRFHKVTGGSAGAWALSIRGPWRDEWREYLPEQDAQVKLVQGRGHHPRCQCPQCDGGPE